MPLSEVVAAVKSLYADELRPFGRLLIRRCAERCGRHPGELPRIDTAHLRSICETTGMLLVVQEEGSSGEYSVLLPGRAGRFVDASSNEDPFAEKLWAEAAAFFSASASQELLLPSGRYACAQALSALAPRFLAGLSLGQVCLLVQLAISKRQILGYRDNQTVPYECSAVVVKRRCANLEQPAFELLKETLPIADLAQARQGLQALLSGCRDGGVPLCNVKRLFRSHFGLELSETVLGHSRICDLVRDERLADTCSLCVRGGTYMMTPPGAVGVVPAAEGLAAEVPNHPAPLHLPSGIQEKLGFPVATPSPRSVWRPTSLLPGSGEQQETIKLFESLGLVHSTCGHKDDGTPVSPVAMAVAQGHRACADTALPMRESVPLLGVEPLELEEGIELASQEVADIATPSPMFGAPWRCWVEEQSMQNLCARHGLVESTHGHKGDVDLSSTGCGSDSEQHSERASLGVEPLNFGEDSDDEFWQGSCTPAESIPQTPSPWPCAYTQRCTLW